jgi:hypothetical protein
MSYYPQGEEKFDGNNVYLRKYEVITRMNHEAPSASFDIMMWRT